MSGNNMSAGIIIAMIAQYFVEFIFYSFLGWVWESIYCTLKEHKWQDRGFLFGPVCPIYGFSVTGGAILFSFVPVFSDPSMPVYQIFLTSMTVSAVMEYATSYVLEKKFHARWWDYSSMPLNIHGRICLPCTLGFGAAGVVIVKYLLPFVSEAHHVLPSLAYEALSIVFAIIIGADLALTQASLSELLTTVESFHDEFNERAENTYQKIQEAPHAMAENLEYLQEQLQNARARAQASASERIHGLSSGAKHVLRSMAVFHAGENMDSEGRSAGERLKEAQSRLEEKIRKSRQKQ